MIALYVRELMSTSWNTVPPLNFEVNTWFLLAVQQFNHYNPNASKSSAGGSLMAKLKDQMTSQELLDLILSGTMKSELIKKHKTSDEELAIMLLPMYRNGDLTKEEFNDFFKGVLLSPRHTTAQRTEDTARAPSQEDLPPSEILRSLAAERYEATEAAKSKEETPRMVLDMDAPPSAGGDLDFAEQFETESSQYVQSDAAVQSSEEVSAFIPSGSAEVDSATISSALNMIFVKLGSIDSRLAALEKKLGAD
jgi:hypothetical protein